MKIGNAGFNEIKLSEHAAFLLDQSYKIEVFLYKAVSRLRGVSHNSLPHGNHDG